MGDVLHACNPCTQEVEKGGPEIQGHPYQHIKSEASLGSRDLV